MREIHDIRVKIHEETKGMTPEQRAQHANTQAQELLAKYNLKTLSIPEALNRKIV